MAILKRDLALAYRQRAELMQPMLFFVLVISLFPLAVGPEPKTLQLIGPGVIWVAAILSSLLGLERLFRDDFQDGSLEQLMLSSTSLPAAALVKVLAHWLTSIDLIIASVGVIFTFERTHVLGIVKNPAIGHAFIELNWCHSRRINCWIKSRWCVASLIATTCVYSFINLCYLCGGIGLNAITI